MEIFLEPIPVTNQVTETSMNPALVVNRATEISSIQALTMIPVWLRLWFWLWFGYDSGSDYGGDGGDSGWDSVATAEIGDQYGELIDLNWAEIEGEWWSTKMNLMNG